MKRPKPFSLSIGSAVVALLALVAMPSRPAVLPAANVAAFATEETAALPPGTDQSPSSEGPSTASARQAEDELTQWHRQLERAERLPWGRDPFMPTVVVDPGDPDVDPTRRAPRSRLTGISLLDGERLAIIDRNIVRTGDALPSGFVVAEIGHHTVTLRQGTNQVTLVIGDE